MVRTFDENLELMIDNERSLTDFDDHRADEWLTERHRVYCVRRRKPRDNNKKKLEEVERNEEVWSALQRYGAYLKIFGDPETKKEFSDEIKKTFLSVRNLAHRSFAVGVVYSIYETWLNQGEDLPIAPSKKIVSQYLEEDKGIKGLAELDKRIITRYFSNT